MPALVFLFKEPVLFFTANGEEIVLQLLGLLMQKKASYTVVKDGETYLFNLSSFEPFAVEAIGSKARLTIPSEYVAQMEQAGQTIETNIQVIRDNFFHLIQLPRSRRVSALIYTADEGFVRGLAVKYPPTKQILQ